MLKVFVFNQIHWESIHYLLTIHYAHKILLKILVLKGENTFKAVIFLHPLTGLLFPNKIQENEHQRPILSGRTHLVVTVNKKKINPKLNKEETRWYGNLND